MTIENDEITSWKEFKFHQITSRLLFSKSQQKPDKMFTVTQSILRLFQLVESLTVHNL